MNVRNTVPTVPTVPSPADLIPPWDEIWQERAAVMQHDGGLPAEQADALAQEDVAERMRAGEWPYGLCPCRACR
jgi:hypothetical protein